MSKEKTKGKKNQMEEIKIEIQDLLNRYKNWVANDGIQFLKEKKDQEKILSCIDELDSVFEDANKKARDKKKEVDFSEDLDWYEAHQKGTELWKSLASCALNDIDPESKGNSKLFDFLKAATDFEELLYGLEPYYRDHTLHSLWVYLIGEYLQRDCLPGMYKNPNWYILNDVERDKDEYEYDDDIVNEAGNMEKKYCEEVNEKKDAIWCLMALFHDLGYSLSKLSKINDRVKDVLGYFILPEFQRIGYSLDIEQQYNVSQFLDLMAMDVRIEPSDNHKNKTVIIQERVLVKGYKDNSTYWRLCRAFEQKKHGILSAYLVYKILGIFADTWVRDPAERWGFDDPEVTDNIKRGGILFGIAQHDFDFAHLNVLGSLADLLMLADELEEFSRYGRQLTTRKYHDTIAKSNIEFEPRNPKKGEDIKINIKYYVSKEADFNYFFKRKTKRLCEIYSLEDRPSPKQNKYENEICKIESIKMTAINIDKDELFFTLNRGTAAHTGLLPNHKKMAHLRRGEYKLRFRDDKLYVYSMDDEKPLCGLDEWIPDPE